MTRGRRTPHRQSGPYIRTAAQSPRPQQSSKLMPLEPLLWLSLPAFTLAGSLDNFQVPLGDASKKGYQELLTGTIQVLICIPYMFVKFYEFVHNLPPVLTFRSWIDFPTWPPNVRIFRDTAVVVTISYVLLLDINLNYLWLVIFPAIAIAFIYALYMELCRPGSGHGIKECGNDKEITIKIPVELELIVMMPFGALLVMAQLDDHAADRFAISQFLLFLSSTLAALTRMMMRLPVGASPSIARTSELLHKTLLLLLLVTAHTVAGELLGEDVVLVCMPELVPVLLWFSLIHHDGAGSSVINVDKMKPLIVLGAVVPPLFAYLASSMDESGLSWCTMILISCAVSGCLTYYTVFMLRSWPGQQEAAKDVDHGDVSGATSKKQVGKGKVMASLDQEAVPSKKQAVCLGEAVQLLKFWANALLMVAAALLLLEYLVAVRLGLQQPLLDILCQNFQRPACSFSPPPPAGSPLDNRRFSLLL